MNARMTLNRIALCVAAIGALAATTAHALTLPIPSDEDPHKQIIQYTDDVVAVQGKIGMLTMINFGKGEVVQTYGIGDSDAWTVKYNGNQIYFVPKASQGDTNLYVKTNRHEYWFSIALNSKKLKLPTTWSLSVSYPYNPADATANADPAVLAAKEKKQIADAFQLAKRQGTLNGDYGFIGPDPMMPTSAYDNGEFTYLTFQPGQPVPDVFAENPDGTETRINKNFDATSNMWIVHRVARKLMIRGGNEAGCLINGHFKPTGPNPNTNTTSPSVVREVVPQEVK